MHLKKILILVAIGLFCTNARVIKKKIRKRITPSCGCPLPVIESTYGCFGKCNYQNIFLDESPNYCGCPYVDTYGVIEPELPNYGRMSSIKMPFLPISNCDPGLSVASIGKPVGTYEILPAINLPGLCDPLAMPCLNELPCSCQVPISVQNADIPYGCCTKMKYPFVERPLCLPQIVQLPLCSCPTMPCSCQSVQCGRQNVPCGCQNMPCSCKNMPCACQSTPCVCQCQNTQKYGLQLPLELPCACQTCQMSPVELPVMSCGCQTLPSPVIGCEGKYLRQVIIQPPFL